MGDTTVKTLTAPSDYQNLNAQYGGMFGPGLANAGTFLQQYTPGNFLNQLSLAQPQASDISRGMTSDYSGALRSLMRAEAEDILRQNASNASGGGMLFSGPAMQSFGQGVTDVLNQGYTNLYGLQSNLASNFLNQYAGQYAAMPQYGLGALSTLGQIYQPEYVAPQKQVSPGPLSTIGNIIGGALPGLALSLIPGMQPAGLALAGMGSGANYGAYRGGAASQNPYASGYASWQA